MTEEIVPRHVAIIMDGNRRWAKKRGLPPVMGHRAGAKNLLKVVEIAASLNIKILTVFAFSTENSRRSKEEVDALMDLLEKYLVEQKEQMIKKRVKLTYIGDFTKCSSKLNETLKETQNATQYGDKIELILALNYGGRDEILRAAKKIAQAVKQENLTIDSLNEKIFESYLDTANISSPDLIIRTSGESRLSNFLLWQAAYSELFVSDTLWPDFSDQDLKEAILDYQKRTRRFGK